MAASAPLTPPRDNRIRIMWQQVIVLLVAALLACIALAAAARLHPDEAFYLTIAREAAVEGDWLLTHEPLDKPPLTYYQNALALTLFAVDSDANGVLYLDAHKGEFAGRIGAVFWSVLLVAAGMAWAHALGFSQRECVLVGVLLTLSPLRIGFAATAFTDMPMLALGTLALWQATRRNAAAAGIWWALSLAAKPQTIFFAPLLPLLYFYTNKNYVDKSSRHTAQHSDHRHYSIQHIAQAGLRFIIPVGCIAAVILLWDSVRVQSGAASFLVLGEARYTPTTITPVGDIPARLGVWWSTVRWLFGTGWLTGALLLVAAASTWIQRRRIQQIAGTWLLAFVGAHLLLTLNLFDRNQLVLLPVAAVWVAPALLAIWRRIARFTRLRFFRMMLGSSMALLLSACALSAASGQLPIGGDDGTHDGIDQLAAYLNAQPVATVIYDRWLDWELDYYMGAWTNKRRVYYPTPAQLAQGARSLDEQGTRYFVVPMAEDAAPWVAALRAAGFRVQVARTFSQFTVYALHPPDS